MWCHMKNEIACIHCMNTLYPEYSVQYSEYVICSVRCTYAEAEHTSHTGTCANICADLCRMGI